MPPYNILTFKGKAMKEVNIHTIPEIEAARDKLGDLVRRTPVWQWKSHKKDEILGADTRLHLKLELFQYGGSFKCRGSLLIMFEFSQEQLKRGVTAVSAGNHAISVAYAAAKMETTDKVVMTASSNPIKSQRCKELGAEVALVENVHIAFERVKEIEENEGRALIHPFEGTQTALGTATVGLELCQQVETPDAVIVPVGGGGLIAGIASCIKQMDENIQVVGVEPEGADSMSRSLKAG